ncbi:MAG: hypothetical protein KDE00_00930 [Rhodobacteraceae bacterium]|nr:hypothetical protein [Paracoccaceae bacterium]
MQTAIALLVLVLMTLVMIQIVAAGRFRARILREAANLRQLPAPEPRRDLPEIVYAFARKAGADPDHPPCTAALRQKAEIRLKPGGPFAPIEAWQTIALGKPGFVWDARADGAVMKFRVLDAYAGGLGHLEARAFGSVRVASARGADADVAEGMRYLAELPWAPDAMLGNRDIHWRQIDAEHVEARIETAGGPARVVFRFSAEGDIVAVAAQARPATDEKGRPVRYDWRGRFSGYHTLGGRRIPTEAEVGYLYPSGYEAYFRCEVTGYDVQP